MIKFAVRYDEEEGNLEGVVRMGVPCPFCGHDLEKVRQDHPTNPSHYTFECVNAKCALYDCIVYDQLCEGLCFLCRDVVVMKTAPDNGVMLADGRPFLFHKACMQKV